MSEIKARNGGILHTFNPGQSGNPNGRPPGSRNRATLLKKWLLTPIKIENPETKEEIDCTLEDKIALALIQKAIKGNVAAIREIQDTLYGKIKETIEMQKEQPLFPDTKEENRK